MALTPEQKAEYLKNPGRCPFCGSSDLEGQGYDYDANPAQRIDCQNCGKSWLDIFTLTDIEIIEEPMDDAPGASQADFELSDGGVIECPDAFHRRDLTVPRNHMNKQLATEIENAIGRSRMVAEMDKNRVRRDAKLAILRLVETDIKATLVKLAVPSRLPA